MYTAAPRRCHQPVPSRPLPLGCRLQLLLHHFRQGWTRHEAGLTPLRCCGFLQLLQVLPSAKPVLLDFSKLLLAMAMQHTTSMVVLPCHTVSWNWVQVLNVHIKSMYLCNSNYTLRDCGFPVFLFPSFKILQHLQLFLLFNQMVLQLGTWKLQMQNSHVVLASLLESTSACQQVQGICLSPTYQKWNSKTQRWRLWIVTLKAFQFCSIQDTQESRILWIFAA